MTQSETQKRLKQIRERFGTSPATWEDIGFLLSMIDSQAAAEREFVNNIAAVLDADDVEMFTALVMKAKQSPDLNMSTRSALRSETEVADDAVTQMRDACVEIVKECLAGRARTSPESEDYEYDQAVCYVLYGVIDKLSSLTLDTVKQKEQS